MLASGTELSELHDLIQNYLRAFGKDVGQVVWGFQGGNKATRDTFLFTVPEGVLYFGSTEMETRWWLAVGLENDIPSDMLNIRFEFNIPKKPSNQTSLRFIKRGERTIEVLHSGRVTAGVPVSPVRFFDYYAKNPWHWTVIEEQGHSFLQLCTIDLDRTDYFQWFEILSTLAKFANFVTWFKDWVKDPKH